MKPLTLLMTALALTASTAATPTWAEGNAQGAKGLFFQQLDQPSANLNTGIQYWIELKKGEKVLRANNKTAFHSGDRIRFHMTPNIDGYAYIVLRSGSRGEQEVLFPVAERKDDNHVTRGQEVVLPEGGMLQFDQNPGIEKISLIVSREPLDTTKLVMPETQQPVRIAMLDSGSKDLIPNSVFVAYNDVPERGLPGQQVAGASEGATKRAADTSKEHQGARSARVANERAAANSKPQAAKPGPEKKHEQAAGTEAGQGSAVKSKVSRARLASKPGHAAAQPPAAIASKHTDSEPGVVTVVFNQPAGVLSAEISLNHK